MSINTLENRKTGLIKQISNLRSEEDVLRLEEFVRQLEKSPDDKHCELLDKYAVKIKEKIDLEELIREQNWKPIDRKEFDKLVKELDIQEPIEQLLADI